MGAVMGTPDTAPRASSRYGRRYEHARYGATTMLRAREGYPEVSG